MQYSRSHEPQDTYLSFPRRRESILRVVQPMDSRFHGNDADMS